jgi:hypothetical protein
MTANNSAPGADQLSSSQGVSTSRADASLTVREPTEPENVPAICKAQAGGQSVSRRNFMNSIVALPIAAAVPTGSPLVAAAPDPRAPHAYAAWLHMERRLICLKLWPDMGRRQTKSFLLTTPVLIGISTAEAAWRGTRDLNLRSNRSGA